MSTFVNYTQGGRFGNAAGNAAGVGNQALFLKVFSGEVLTTFNTSTVMLDKHTIRTIPSGRSAQFPITGRLSSSYHTPGTEITTVQQGVQQERTINVDARLICPVFFPDLDEALTHYDYRSIYTREAGLTLARQFDIKTLQVALRAARSAHNLGTPPAHYPAATEKQITNATAATNAESLLQSIAKAAELLDRSDVPETDRYAIIRPAQYYLVLNDGQAVHRDFGNTGSQQRAMWTEWAGIRIYKSNHLPSTDLTTSNALFTSGAAHAGVRSATDFFYSDADQADQATVEQNDYSGNFTTTVASVFHRSAIGTLKIQDISTQIEPSVRHQGTLVLARYLMGHGVLRPESACEIRTDAGITPIAAPTAAAR
jgi:hypothetical protein